MHSVFDTGDIVRIKEGFFGSPHPWDGLEGEVYEHYAGTDLALGVRITSEGLYQGRTYAINPEWLEGTGAVSDNVPTDPKKKEKKLTAWELADIVIPNSRITLLYGPPGTGKTTAGNFAGNPESVFNVTLTEETPAAELRGHYVPRGGDFIWQDGPALTAYRHGARLVLNEIDKASGDAMTFCHALLDDPGISAITLPTGETVKPHPGFSVVATTNGDPSDLPEALADRFSISIQIPLPHPEAIASLPQDLREAAKKSASGSSEARVTFRAWKNFSILRDSIGEDAAALAVFGPRAKSILDTLKIARKTS